MSQVMTGARGVVKIKGVVVGFIGGVNVTLENTITDVEVMGQLEVGDLAETGHKCSFTINYFKTFSDSNTLHPSNGPAQVQTGDNTAASILGLDTSIANKDLSSMRSQTYFDCSIEDQLSADGSNVVFEMIGCKWEGGSGQMDARGIWQGTWNFKARKSFRV